MDEPAPHQLPRYCYRSLPALFLWLACAPLVAFRRPAPPVWWYVLMGVCAVVFGLPMLRQYARILGQVGRRSRGKLHPLAQWHFHMSATLGLFRLPPALAGRRRWFAWVYYGSMIASCLAALVLTVVGVASRLRAVGPGR